MKYSRKGPPNGGTQYIRGGRLCKKGEVTDSNGRPKVCRKLYEKKRNIIICESGRNRKEEERKGR